MPQKPYLKWPVFRRSLVAAFQRSLTHSFEVIVKVDGKLTTTNRIVISRDGKTMTQTTTGKNAQGQTVNNTTVYEKQ